jgi:hypothetical protein
MLVLIRNNCRLLERIACLAIGALFGFAFLGGCARTDPPSLGLNNPANPEAAEGVTPRYSDRLGLDEETRTTRTALQKAAKEQEQWNQSGPASGGQDQTGSMPGMQH